MRYDNHSGLYGSTDWLESGETMKAAGLKAIDTVVDSTAVLIKSKHPSNQKLVDLIANRISGVISKSSITCIQANPDPSQVPRNTCSVNTMLSALSSRPPKKSRPANGHQQSLRWNRRAGSRLARWWRRK